MIRKEEIKNEAGIYAEKHGFRVPFDGSNNFYDEVDVKASLEGFIAGAKWSDKTMIDKACEWLKDMACYYAHWEYNGDTYEKEVIYDTEKLIEDFRKAMEGGEE